MVGSSVVSLRPVSGVMVMMLLLSFSVVSDLRLGLVLCMLDLSRSGRLPAEINRRESIELLLRCCFFAVFSRSPPLSLLRDHCSLARLVYSFYSRTNIIIMAIRAVRRAIQAPLSLISYGTLLSGACRFSRQHARFVCWRIFCLLLVGVITVLHSTFGSHGVGEVHGTYLCVFRSRTRRRPPPPPTMFLLRPLIP